MRLTYKFVASGMLKGCTHRRLHPQTCMVNPTTITQGGGKKLTFIDLWLIHLQWGLRIIWAPNVNYMASITIEKKT